MCVYESWSRGPQQLNEGHSRYTHSQTHRYTPDRQTISHLEIRAEAPGARRGEGQRWSGPHPTLACPLQGFIIFFLHFLLPGVAEGEGRECSRKQRQEASRQDGRRGGLSVPQALQMAPASFTCMAKSLDHLRQTPEAQGQQKPDGGPPPLAPSVLASHPPLGWQAAQGQR